MARQSVYASAVVFHSGKCPPRATSIYSTPPLAFSEVGNCSESFWREACASNSIVNRPEEWPDLGKSKSNDARHPKKSYYANEQRSRLITSSGKGNISLDYLSARLRLEIDKKPTVWEYRKLLTRSIPNLFSLFLF